MRPMAEWRAVVIQYPCEVCGAAPGEDCATSGGRTSYTPHSLRSRAASQGHWDYPIPDPPGRGDGHDR